MSGAAHIRIARARGEADAAKARLASSLDEAKARLAPGKLASDAVQSAKDKSIVVADEAVTTIKENAGLSAGIAAVAALYFARKPLFSAARGLFGGDADGTDTDTHDHPPRRSAGEEETFNG